MEQNALATRADAVAYLLSARHADLEREDATLFGTNEQERKREREVEAQLDEVDRHRAAVRTLRERLATCPAART
jgi:hypothetical protein